METTSFVGIKCCLMKKLSYEEEPVAILDRESPQVEVKGYCIYQGSMEESTN